MLLLLAGMCSPKDIRKQVSKVVPVDATVEEVFGQDLSALGLRAYVPGGGIYITGTPFKSERASLGFPRSRGCTRAGLRAAARA